MRFMDTPNYYLKEEEEVEEEKKGSFPVNK